MVVEQNDIMKTIIVSGKAYINDFCKIRGWTGGRITINLSYLMLGNGITGHSMNTEEQRGTAAGAGTFTTYSGKRAPAPNPPQAVTGDPQPHEWSPSMTLCQSLSRSPFTLVGFSP